MNQFQHITKVNDKIDSKDIANNRMKALVQSIIEIFVKFWIWWHHLLKRLVNC